MLMHCGTAAQYPIEKVLDDGYFGKRGFEAL